MQTTSRASDRPALRRHDDFPHEWRGLAWYALRVAPGAEFLAADRLSSMGVPTACPLRVEYRRRSRHARTREPMTFPLLAGYLFAAVGERDWRPVMSQRHVYGVVGADGRPSVVATAELVSLCRRSAAGAFSAAEYQRNMRTGREFKVGDRVEVFGAGLALDGWVFEVSALHGDTARVVMQMLGGEREVSVSVDRLVAA